MTTPKQRKHYMNEFRKVYKINKFNLTAHTMEELHWDFDRKDSAEVTVDWLIKNEKSNDVIKYEIWDKMVRI